MPEREFTGPFSAQNTVPAMRRVVTDDVEKELRRRSVTRLLLWEEDRAANPDGFDEMPAFVPVVSVESARANKAAHERRSATIEIVIGAIKAEPRRETSKQCCARFGAPAHERRNEQLKADPYSGVIICFRSKRADRVKLIFWDGTGLCLFAKRLEGGRFRRPRIEDGVMRLSAAQLAALIEGLDWMRVRARRVRAPEAVQ
jgi:transposase